MTEQQLRERAEAILKDSANNHSYESWPEMVYDCHDKIVVDYTVDAMIELVKQELQRIGEVKDLEASDNATMKPSCDAPFKDTNSI